MCPENSELSFNYLHNKYNYLEERRNNITDSLKKNIEQDELRRWKPGIKLKIKVKQNSRNNDDHFRPHHHHHIIRAQNSQVLHMNVPIPI